MKYKRTIVLQSSRLNDQDSYDALHLGLTSKNVHEVREAFMHALRNSHGHNFKVTIEAEPKDVTTFTRERVIPDEELVELLKRYDNVNLSVLEEFLEDEEQTTTENVATMIFNIVADSWPDVSVSVTIQENEHIEARYP